MMTTSTSPSDVYVIDVGINNKNNLQKITHSLSRQYVCESIDKARVN